MRERDNYAVRNGAKKTHAPPPEKRKGGRRGKKRTSQVWGASLIPIGLPSTSHCNIGHTSTVADPKNETRAGLVSTSATLWLMYPNDTKPPPNSTCPRSVGLNFDKNGDNTSDANTILEDVAALAGKLSFIIAPNGKFVPYSTATKARTKRGPTWVESTPSMNDIGGISGSLSAGQYSTRPASTHRLPSSSSSYIRFRDRRDDDDVVSWIER